MQVGRRMVLQAGAVALGAAGSVELGAAQEKLTRLEPVAFAPDRKLSIERRGQVALFGLNRPYIQNRVDPELFRLLARAYYAYEHDPELRAAVLFGHGPNFSRGIDVDAFKDVARSQKSVIDSLEMIDPLAKSVNRLTKPLVVVCHGDTWNMAHELHLTADIRIASSDVRFGQDENTHGRFPGGGSTIRFVRECGWGNAMRYMLTGDHWNAAEAFRMGEVQEIAPSPEEALARGIEFAQKIAACGPLGIKTTLVSAHLVFDKSDATAFAALDAQYGALYYTRDFQEGRDAEAQGRAPVYTGN